MSERERKENTANTIMLINLLTKRSCMYIYI